MYSEPQKTRTCVEFSERLNNDPTLNCIMLLVNLTHFDFQAVGNTS